VLSTISPGLELFSERTSSSQPFQSCKTYYWFCIINHATDPNSGIASAYSFWVFKLALVLSGVRIAKSSCVVFGRLLFVHLFCFLLAIVLSVNLRFSATGYPFGISKLILCRWLLVCFVCFEFVPFSVAHFIVWFMDSDYLFGIFKLSKLASICIRVAYFFYMF